MTNDKLADEIERILAEYHRAVELDDASLLPKIMSQWCDIFFKPGASAILAALRHSEPAIEEHDGELWNPGVKALHDYPNLQMMMAGCVSGNHTEWPMLRIELRRLLAQREPATEAVLEAASYLLDVWEDGKLDHEHRAYIEGAFTDAMTELANALKVKAAPPDGTQKLAAEIVKKSGGIMRDVGMTPAASPERPQSGEMVMVPREPTAVMVDAGIDQMSAQFSVSGDEGLCRVYRAMLAAAEAERGKT